MKRTAATTSIALAALLGGALALPLTAGSSARAAQVAALPTMPVQIGDTCTALTDLRLNGVTITSAVTHAEGAALTNSGLSPMFGNAAIVGKAPAAMCRVVGHIRPTADSDIGFEVWLPASGWDGRLHGVGIGGFAGAIDYFTLGQAVRAGQAAVASDTGHGGGMMDSSWSKGHPEKVRDYSWRAIHLSTVAAKQVIREFYGKAPDKSYFVGCSGGGRQGLVEAARFPDDYDGIVSGAPAASFTELGMALINAHQAQVLPGSAIRPAQAKFLQEEVLKQCDILDGQSDGLIADPRQCRFDANKLLCSNSSSLQCFSEGQIGALRRIYSGPRSPDGRVLAASYLPSGSEAGDPAPALGWESYLLAGDKGKNGGRVLADGMLDGLIQKPFATVESFDWNRDPARLKAVSGEIDAPVNLSRFFARGGKLVIWHGWADAAIPPEASLRYHAAMLRQSGPKANASVRLFMVPGVQHCFGGKGPDVFGQSGAPARSDMPDRNLVRAVQDWTEGKRPAPEMLIGRRGHGGGMFGAPAAGPERQRLLCAWPKRESLIPGGDADKAASYLCK
ncbi:MAG: tannase/feruloyl esterase family alpha/beta hydrolase [Novosphingobium sp.]